ncbi:MATE family efflux transporter DinF [Dongshaea marina]|uniref:MATE family efflux transporter DinF n=1 Tax=Dongshaea marina TaxID=2047966 RepID=UPI000D3E1674|nr:MATE family efflux transporter DinF [Dongshaea marina]
MLPSWFVQKSAHRRVFSLALPMVLSSVSVPLLGLADTVVIGHLDKSWYLGGVSVGSMVINLLFWLLGFLRMSTTGLTAQALGAGDGRQQLLILGRSLLVALVLALIILLLHWPLAHWLFQLTGGSTEVRHYAEIYFKIRVWSAPAALANLALLGWMIGMQNARGPMLLLILTNLVNIVLDVWFVIGLGWGVAGSASASVLADYCGLAFALLYCSRMLSPLWKEFGEKLWRQLASGRELLLMMGLNRDIFIRSLCLQLCFAFMTMQGAALGDNIVAANAILLNFLMFISYGLDGFAYASEAMAGHALGRGKRSQFRQVVILNLFWGGLVAIGFSLVYGLGGDLLIGLITSLKEVQHNAELYLPWLVAIPMLSAWCFILDGVFVGATWAKEMRNAMLVATTCFFFPIWWLLSSYGNHALWAAMSAFMLGRGLSMALILWRKERRFNQLSLA